MKFYKALRTRRVIGFEQRDDGSCRSLIVHLWYWTWLVKRQEIAE
jgi:hypothetical protein